MTDLAIFLAEQVRKLRTQAAMTQAELASRAGVTVETVARLERVLRGRASANANPSLETMERIASSLGVDVSDLVSPSKTRPKDDRLNVVLRGASGAVRRRLHSVHVAGQGVRRGSRGPKPLPRNVTLHYWHGTSATV